MCGGERDVLLGMPILREDDVIELSRQGVDHRNHPVSLGDPQGSPRHKVVLYVDDQENVSGLKVSHVG